jgi:hypothetical protein
MTSVIKAAALNVSQSTEECINFVRIPLGMEADLVLLGAAPDRHGELYESNPPIEFAAVGRKLR